MSERAGQGGDVEDRERAQERQRGGRGARGEGGSALSVPSGFCTLSLFACLFLRSARPYLCFALARLTRLEWKLHLSWLKQW